MRILYHHRTLADGAEGIHIQEIVEAFGRLGHDVTMMAVASGEERGVGHRGLLSRVKARLPGPVFELAAAVYNLVDFAATRSAIRTHRPDLIYKRHALYDVGVALAARSLRVPMVLEANCAYSSAHNQRFEHVTFKRLARWCERRAVDAAVVVAAVSTPMAAYLRGLASDPARVLVVPNGANPDRFHPASREGRSGRLVVGWSGILREWHRVDLLIEAAAGIEAVDVRIVGDGPERPALEARARELGMIDRVHITGRLPHEKMPEAIAGFDIAVAAHDGTGYASPMKLLEYMAVALPVVAPRLPNIEDIITDGEDGLLFEPGNPAALAAVLTRLSGDPSLRARLGAAARATVEQRRNWTAIAGSVLEEARRRLATERAAQGAPAL